jgi:hypothetical protein
MKHPRTLQELEDDDGPLCERCGDQGWIMDMDDHVDCPECHPPPPDTTHVWPWWVYRLWCWLAGHRFLDIAIRHQIWDCERCQATAYIDRDHVFEGEPWSLPCLWRHTGGYWLWRFRQWRNDRKRIRFFHKHRHDHLDDDIPF